MSGKRLRRLALAGCATLLILMAAAVAATGVLSSSLYRKHLRHQRHDPLLGWTNIPGASIPDIYGPGKSLRINSQAFRNDEDFSPKAPRGKIRVVCSGDSMTFGLGVDNSRTWCQDLAALDPRLQTVNMGQIGYGLDQMYLWYIRAGAPLDPDIHILALNGLDLNRLARTGKWRRPRPELHMVAGRLVVSNFPVPEPRNWRQFMPLELLLRFPRLLGLFRETTEDHGLNATLAAHIIDALIQETRARGHLLVIAYLPVMTELDPERPGLWPSFLSQASVNSGALFIDLTDDFRRLPPAARRSLFLKRELTHYNEEGHRLVAAVIHGQLIRRLAPARKGGP